jgi:hypothetical protein
MKNLPRFVLMIVGVLLVLATLAGGLPFGRGLVGFVLCLVLGGTLIVAPLTGLGMLLTCLLLFLFVVGFPILGALIGAQLTGKASVGVWLGLVVGGVIGFKIAASSLVDKLLDPVRKAAEKDE